MTVNTNETQAPAQEVKANEKEYNFAHIRKQLETERMARQQAEEKAAQLEKMAQEKSSAKNDDDDSSSDEPYIDEKRLNRKLASFEKTMEQKIDQKAEQKARAMVEEERRINYLRTNSDFNQVMANENIQKFAEKYPEIAEPILEMPDNFARQKLVYQNIKALGINKPEVKQPTIQEKIDQNRRSPYYQPSGTAAPGYASQGDFSSSGQKNAYQKMQELKNRLRI